MKVFLFSHRGALGDFVLTWPALIHLRWKYSEHHFLGVGKPEHMRLAREMGLVDSWLDCEAAELLPFFSGEALPQALAETESALLWMEDDPKVRALLEPQCAGPVRLHPPFPGNNDHVMDYHLQSLAYFSLPVIPDPEPYLPLSTERASYALIHPGAGSDSKRFDPEFYAFLGNELKARRYPDTRIVLGPQEETLRRYFQNRFPVEEPATVSDLAKLAGPAALFIGNDSGPSHLAAVLGAKTLALYKSTLPAQWGVRGRAAQSLEAAHEAIAMTRMQKALA